MISFVKEMWDFLRQRKKFWLLPLLLVMALLGILIVMAQGSAVAPFIYTLF
jgi:competence protein ComGC